MMPRAIPMPDYVPTPDAIMALFVADDVVLRASEIMRRTKRGEGVRKALWRLTKERRLFRVGYCQYARVPTAVPTQKMRGDRIAELERRVDELEARLARIADAIEHRAGGFGGAPHAAMIEIADAIREAGAS